MAFISWKAKDTSPGGTLGFDLTVTETLISSVTMTEFPVEEGADITDHVRKNADMCTLEVYVSNSPITLENFVDPSSPRGAIQSVQLDLPEFKVPLTSGLGILNRLASLFSSSTPVKALLLQFDTDFSAPIETLQVLTQIQAEARQIDVFGRDWFLEDMILTDIDAPLDEESGDGGKYTLQFKHIRIVQTQQVTKPVSAEPRAKTPQSNGSKGSTDAKPPLQSTAYGLLGKFLGGGI